MWDEASLRRPEFAPESVPVVLADGQTWLLPQPWVVLYPVVRCGKVESVAGNTTFGPEFDRLMEAVDGEGIQVVDVFAVAVFLINRNYSLPDEAYSELLRYKGDDEASEEMLREIMAVARGIGPKRRAAGSA